MTPDQYADALLGECLAVVLLILVAIWASVCHVRSLQAGESLFGERLIDEIGEKWDPK